MVLCAHVAVSLSVVQGDDLPVFDVGVLLSRLCLVSTGGGLLDRQRGEEESILTWRLRRSRCRSTTWSTSASTFSLIPNTDPTCAVRYPTAARTGVSLVVLEWNDLVHCWYPPSCPRPRVFLSSCGFTCPKVRPPRKPQSTQARQAS